MRVVTGFGWFELVFEALQVEDMETKLYGISAKFYNLEKGVNCQVFFFVFFLKGCGRVSCLLYGRELPVIWFPCLL